MTGESYKEAIELLKECYTKPALIRRSHINEIFNAIGVSNEKQVAKLRSFKDKIETHVRGLDSMNVPQETYASIVVEASQEKIPQAISLNMVRSSEIHHLEWSVTDLLRALEKELEVRELLEPMFKCNTGANEKKQCYRRPMERNKGVQ